MANPSKRILSVLPRLFSSLKPSPQTPISRYLTSPTSSTLRPDHFLSNPTSPSALLSRLLSRNPSPKTLIGLPSLPSRSSRFFFSKGSGNVRFGAGVAKSAVRKPLDAVASAVSRYRGALGLQMEAFWKMNYLVVVGAGAVMLCVALWRIMFGIASTFVGLSEGMAKYGFLALAASIVAFSDMYETSERYCCDVELLYPK